MGANPAGPAGTGKTESTKDLAKGLGMYCIVFNCSEQITYKMMGRLFAGLAQQGCWSCLDEFNRIDIEVLSVIAQQLLTIKHALVIGNTETVFEGRKIQIKQGYGVFVTMNPGYAGRTELPDNLKILFRPVAMMIPDYTMIAEIMLLAEGFKQGTVLSKKMVQLYKLASEQLSQQSHYDFGMRALKSVLLMAGEIRRKDPTFNEVMVLIRAMKEANIPKFLAPDILLFQALVIDLFPGVNPPIVDYGNLETQIIKNLEKENLQPLVTFQHKVIQLFDTLEVRFGTMIVGPTGAGKTTNYRVLASSMTDLYEQNNTNTRFQKVEVNVLNPKSITIGELYGDINHLTQD